MSEEVTYPEDFEIPNEWENEQTESVANYVLNDAFAAQLRSRSSDYKEFVFEANKFSLFATPENVSFIDANVRESILNARLWDS